MPHDIMPAKQRTCTQCAKDYSYDPNKKSGATTRRCPSCSKRNARLNLHIQLLSIAGGKCRSCGYNSYPLSIDFIDSRSTLVPSPKPRGRDDKLEWVKDKVALCRNCKHALADGYIEMKVYDANVTPVKVSFFTDSVTTSYVDEYKVASPVTEVEILEPDGNEEGQGMRRANAKVIKE